MSDLNISHGKVSCFVSFPLFGFILVIKLRDLDFENHWNIEIFLIRKYMMLDLNISHGKMSDFDSFPLFEFTLVVKMRDFDLMSLKYFNISW